MKRRTFLIGGSAAVVAGAGGVALGNRIANGRYSRYSATLRAPLDPDGGMAEMVRIATLAPTSHNTQSWLFTPEGRTVAMTIDQSRRTPVVDPDDHHQYVSLGAAAQNLSIAGTAAGRPGTLHVADDGSLTYDWSQARPADHPLLDPIRRRQSTRRDFTGAPVPPATLRALEAAAKADGVRMILIADKARLSQARDLIAQGTGAQMDNPAFVQEVEDWLRFNPSSAMRHGDGLYSAASGNPTMPGFLGPTAMDLFFTRKAEVDRYSRQMDTTPVIAIFFADEATPRHWVEVGRAAQNMLLEATRKGLAAAFLNQPIEVAPLRPDLAKLAGEPGKRPDLLIRLGYAPTLPFAPRRPAAEVMRSA